MDVFSLMDQVESVFSRNVTDDSFSEVLNDLVTTVNSIQAADVDYNTDNLQVFNREDARERHPPVIRSEVMESETYTMNIFTLQNGSRIPLHDHPDMHGIIRVIYGTVKITSYSKISGDKNDIPEDIKNVVSSSKLNSLIPVEVKMSSNVTVNDPSCLLTPTEGNYHEIQAVGGVAVILDILAPPYGDRERHYYSVLETNNSYSQFKTWLFEETEKPSFWCD